MHEDIETRLHAEIARLANKTALTHEDVVSLARLLLQVPESLSRKPINLRATAARTLAQYIVNSNGGIH